MRVGGFISMNRVLLKYKGSPADAEIQLEKAVESIKMDREQKILPDKYLKAQKDTVDLYVSKIFDSMIDEIAKVIAPSEQQQEESK